MTSPLHWTAVAKTGHDLPTLTNENMTALVESIPKSKLAHYRLVESTGRLTVERIMPRRDSVVLTYEGRPVGAQLFRHDVLKMYRCGNNDCHREVDRKDMKKLVCKHCGWNLLTQRCNDV